jgi:hypothetical protein
LVPHTKAANGASHPYLDLGRLADLARGHECGLAHLSHRDADDVIGVVDEEILSVDQS